MRKLSSVLAILALCTSSAFATGDEHDGNTRKCQFEYHNPPVLLVGGCFHKDGTGWIPVLTNTPNIVSFSFTDFTRNERKCDGSQLGTVDTIPAIPCVDFIENKVCESGSPLEVVQKGDWTYCVNSHRGGYFIRIVLRAGCATICDDAGCYKAVATVNVTAHPFEDECPEEHLEHQN